MQNKNTMATCVRDRVKSGLSSLDSGGCEIRVLLTTLLHHDHCDCNCFADADCFPFLGHPSCCILAVFSKSIFLLFALSLGMMKNTSTMASWVRVWDGRGFSSTSSTGCETGFFWPHFFFMIFLSSSCLTAVANYFLFLGPPSSSALAAFGKDSFLFSCPLEWWKTKHDGFMSARLSQ